MFPDLPPMAWVILALGVAWLVIRTWTRRIEERRREERNVRLAELHAEREAMQEESAPRSIGPSSLAAHVSDRGSEPEPAETATERRCVGCRTVNAKSATTCSGCGLEL